MAQPRAKSPKPIAGSSRLRQSNLFCMAQAFHSHFQERRLELPRGGWFRHPPSTHKRSNNTYTSVLKNSRQPIALLNFPRRSVGGANVWLVAHRFICAVCTVLGAADMSGWSANIAGEIGTRPSPADRDGIGRFIDGVRHGARPVAARVIRSSGIADVGLPGETVREIRRSR